MWLIYAFTVADQHRYFRKLLPRADNYFVNIKLTFFKRKFLKKLQMIFKETPDNLCIVLNLINIEKQTIFGFLINFSEPKYCHECCTNKGTV